MDMYNLGQIPSKARINKYLKQAIFGNKYTSLSRAQEDKPSVL